MGAHRVIVDGAHAQVSVRVVQIVQRVVSVYLEPFIWDVAWVVRDEIVLGARHCRP